MLIIYHAGCDDGFGAAWAAWQKYGVAPRYVAAHYGDPPPDVAGEEVLIFDFSYPRAELITMAGAAKSLLLLDHHKTAMEDLVGLPYAQFDLTRSGAVLAHDHIWVEGHPLPSLLSYIQDHDLWLHQLPFSREVSAYVRSFERDFGTWSMLALDVGLATSEYGQTSHDARGRVIGGGRALRRYAETRVRAAVRHARWRSIDGWKVPVVNETNYQSEVASALAELEGAAFGACYFDRGNGLRQYSLRSVDDFDVSTVARNMGGGGHQAAAGFTITLAENEEVS